MKLKEIADKATIFIKNRDKFVFVTISLVIFTFLLNLVFPMPWFTKTSHISTFGSGPGISISPNKDKMLMFHSYNGNTSITLYNINTRKKYELNSYKAKASIESEFMGWYDNDRYMIKEQNSDSTNYILTKDFNKYEVLYSVPDGAFKEATPDGLILNATIEELSPDGNKLIIKDKKNKKIILYEDGKEVWSLDKYYDRYISDWSESGKYLIITEKLAEEILQSNDGETITSIETPDLEGLYILNTEDKTINMLKLEIAKKYKMRDMNDWVHNNDIVAFRVFNHAKDKADIGIYTLDVENQVLSRLNTDGLLMDLIEDLQWSPDGRYLTIIAMDAIYVYDTQAKQNPLKQLFKVNQETSINKNMIQWSDDSKHILFTIRKTTLNFLKPADYYLAKVDIDSGKIKKRFIRASLDNDMFEWLNDNEVIYTLHGNSLYRTELNW